MAIAAVAAASLFDSAPSLAQNAYITNELDGTVSVIDTATNLATATITVGTGTFPHGVAVSPDGSKVYVANEDANTVSVIDTATNKVISAAIPVGRDPAAFGVFIRPSVPFSALSARLIDTGGRHLPLSST